MKNLSIRVRLTAWYFAVLAVTFCLVGAGMALAMRRSVHAAVDEDLQSRFRGVQRFMERQVPRLSLEELRDEFREHSGLRPGGDLFQVTDDQGNWIFQSTSIRRYQVATVPPDRIAEPICETIRAGGTPVRILSARVQVSGRPYTVQLGAPMGEFYEVLHRFRWLVLSTMPVVLLLASFGGYWMSRRALAPVDEITKTARSISAHNLSQRLAVPQTGDELQRLSETLNDMMGRLESAFKKITRFTADASHELRTPTALVRTTAELSLRKQRPEAEYREALGQILTEAERTTYLIENLMTLARADSGAEALRISTIDLAGALREACAQGQTLAAAKQVVFESQIPAADFLVEGDPQALRRLFLILIDNAVKYTPSGGSVSVSLNGADGFAKGEIRDSGMGISPEDLPNIFERFYRADKARSREQGGVGLGLSIAQWIAEAHGAVIEVESAPGKGSLFRVRIPARANRRVDVADD